jgi:hypothetical protein
LTRRSRHGKQTPWRCDSTTIRVDSHGRDAGALKNWQTWVLAAPDAVVYRIEDSRSTEAAKKVLGGFRGVAMTDGYAAYEALAKDGGPRRGALLGARPPQVRGGGAPSSPRPRPPSTSSASSTRSRSCATTGPPGEDLRRQLRNERSREIVRESAKLAGVEPAAYLCAAARWATLRPRAAAARDPRQRLSRRAAPLTPRDHRHARRGAARSYG